MVTKLFEIDRMTPQYLSMCDWCHAVIELREKDYHRPHHYCGWWHRILDRFWRQ